MAIPEPRKTTKIVANEKMSFAQIGTAESFADRISAKSHIGSGVKYIHNTANIMPKLTKKTLETHEVNEALLLQGKVIENLSHAVEYVVEGYDTSAQIISDIHRLLNAILNVRFIPTGKEFYKNVKIKQPRQLAVILANATAKLGSKEDIFDKRHARVEIGKAMISIRKTAGELKGLPKKPDEREYQEIVKAFQSNDAETRKKLHEKYEGLITKQHNIITNISNAIEHAIEEYDSVAFFEADIAKIVNILVRVDKRASELDSPLLPRTPLAQFKQKLLMSLEPFAGWLHIARIDMIDFQNEWERIMREIPRRQNLIEYRKFLLDVLKILYGWTKTATIDQQSLEVNIAGAIEQIKALNV